MNAQAWSQSHQRLDDLMARAIIIATTLTAIVVPLFLGG